MTSHYMLCKISNPFDQTFQYLSKYFGNIHSEQLNLNFQAGKSAVILGESYFVRTNGAAAVLMILKEENASTTCLEIISCAGASGILDISLGAHSSYVHQIRDSLQRAGFTVEVIKEIPNYTSSPQHPF